MPKTKDTILIYCGCNCGGIEVDSQKQADELDKNGCPVCKERARLQKAMLNAEMKSRIIADELNMLTLTPREKELKRQMFDTYAGEFLNLQKEHRVLKSIKRLSDMKMPPAGKGNKDESKK